jgi:peptide-methionine (R)-S-oxide reductase
MSLNKLTPAEERVILHKGTERPFTGEYDDFYRPGTYICRRCNAPLFSAQSKFDAGCGWPAFDDSYPNALKRLVDADGYRVEIQCANCGGHLGHEFVGERLTAKNTRECVNSLSIRFVPEGKELPAVIQP